ncbi:MAG: hypothetical protein JXA74_06880, partial [Anaerolineae bacterium]|nr:hypothetical protein [Anaerolineae bacterium]
MARRSRTRLWARWVLANTVGKLLGLGATFAIGAGLFSGLADAPGLGPALLSAALMTATGALEGAIVGLAQWSVLQRALAGVQRRAWVVATILGAVVAWLLGSIPMTLTSLSSETPSSAGQEPPQAVVLALAAAMGLAAGLILSAWQWRALRRHASGAWRWLPANALAWAVGMPLIFAGVDWAQKAGSVAGAVLVMAGCIALAGALVGAIHGVALVTLAGARRVV